MPLLGSYGGSSEYAYRGTIDNFPNDFLFTDLTEVEPGGIYSSETVTITGINNKVRVSVSAGSSISINGGEFVSTSEESPLFLNENDTIAISIPTTSGSTLDFNKVYSSNIKVGKKETIWSVSTKTIDQTPEPFSFTDLVDREVGIAFTSNEIILSGLEPGFSFPISIVSGNGQISINGGSLVASGIGSNGDRVYLRLNSPFEFSNNPSGSGTRTNETSVQVGTFTTSWAVSSRDVDVFIDPFDFPNRKDVQPSSIFLAQAVNSLGVVTSITGADPGIELIAVVTGCELQIQRPDGFIRSGFSSEPKIAFNGDLLTARIQSGPGFSETRVGIVTVSSQTAQFIVTTRPRPIDTIPDPFTFTDLTGVQRNILVESNEITLSGMTTSFTDEGTASITTGGTGGDAQFQVTRNGNVVRSYGNSTFKVRNGDKIKLRIKSSDDSNGSVNATFRVDGIDTSFILSGQTAFRDDVWTVTSIPRICDITPFTLDPINDAEPEFRYTRSFFVDGFESDCGMRVTTSDPNSSLSASGQTGQNISVSPGTEVTVSFTSGGFSEIRSTTITVSNASSGKTPQKQYNTTWSITTRRDNRPATVSLTASSQLVQSGSPVTLNWSSFNAFRVTNTIGSGFNVSPFTLSGSTTVFPTVAQNYSITIEPNTSAENFPSPVTASVFISVEDPEITPFTIQPRTNVDPNTEVSASFIVDGFQSTSGVIVTTSDPNSSLSVNGGPRGNFLPVNPGSNVTVFLRSSPNFSTTRTTNIVASNSTSGKTPVLSYSTNWSVTTKADNTPASVTLTANKTQISKGESVNLSWSSVNAQFVTSSIGQGFSVPSSQVNGSTTVFPQNSGNYSIGVVGFPGASNFPITQTSSVFITVNVSNLDDFKIETSGIPATADTFFTNPGLVVRNLVFDPQLGFNKPSVGGLSPGETVIATLTTSTPDPDASFTVFRSGPAIYSGKGPFNVQNNDTLFVKGKTPPSSQSRTYTLTIGTKSSSITITSPNCVPKTKSQTLTTGVFLEVKDSPASSTPLPGPSPTKKIITGINGSSANNVIPVATLTPPGLPPAFGGGGSTFVREQIFSGSKNIPISQPGVTQVTAYTVGKGGNGGKNRGGGGGGTSTGTIPVSPGGTITLSVTNTASSVLYNGSTKVTSNAGRPGPQGGGGGSGNRPGKSGGTPNAFGKGTGGSAGGFPFPAQPGSPSPPSVSEPSRIGGSGGGFVVTTATSTLATTGKNAPSGPSLQTATGVPGSQYGGGGGTGRSSGSGDPGGSGAPGQAFIEYTFSQSSGSSKTETYRSLYTKIASQYQSTFNRLPTDLEFLDAFNKYILPNFTLDKILTDISDSQFLSTSPITGRPRFFGPLFDTCGNPI